jgi:hypothetical protein
MIIYKGKPDGRIQRSFKDFPPGALYECQDKAWMDERVMLVWVESVLRPYLQTAPEGVHHIIILDSFRCHMMKSVVDAIQDLGCEALQRQIKKMGRLDVRIWN